MSRRDQNIMRKAAYHVIWDGSNTYDDIEQCYISIDGKDPCSDGPSPGPDTDNFLVECDKPLITEKSWQSTY